jgi:hypothetical protein
MYLPSSMLALHAAVCGNLILKVVMRIIANSELMRFHCTCNSFEKPWLPYILATVRSKCHKVHPIYEPVYVIPSVGNLEEQKSRVRMSEFPTAV